MKDDSSKTLTKKTKRWRIVTFYFGGFVFSTLLFWALWAAALKDILPKGIWFLIFVAYQLLFGVILFVSYKISLKRLRREIVKESERILSTEDAIETENKIRKYLRFAIILQIFCSFLIIILSVLLYSDFFQGDIVPISVVSGNNLNYLTIILVVLTAYSLWNAYRFPKILLKSYKRSPNKILYRPWTFLWTLHVLRVGLINAVAIYGFILGLFGGSWMVTMPFFVVFTVSQVLIFPTQKKWLRKMEEIKQALEADK